MKFRLARKEEIDEIFTIFSNAIDKMSEQNIFQWDTLYPSKEIICQDIENRQLYLSMIDNVIACIYVLNRECDLQYECGNWSNSDGSYYVIHRLCVNPIFQNQGMGTAAVKHIEKKAKRRKALYVRLDVFSQNPYACSMYKRLGYNKVGTIHNRKGTFYLMEKRL